MLVLLTSMPLLSSIYNIGVAVFCCGPFAYSPRGRTCDCVVVGAATETGACLSACRCVVNLNQQKGCCAADCCAQRCSGALCRRSWVQHGFQVFGVFWLFNQCALLAFERVVPPVVCCSSRLLRLRHTAGPLFCCGVVDKEHLQHACHSYTKMWLAAPAPAVIRVAVCGAGASAFEWHIVTLHV